MLDAENKIKSYIRKIYKNNRDASRLFNSIVSLIDEDNLASKKKLTSKNWSQKSSFLITYADSIKSENDSPLLVLNQFLQKYIDSIDSIHILPFMPSSSDSGFSVIDYYKIDEKLGNWEDLNLISKNKNIMIDIVLNHASRNSKWFTNFLKGSGQGHDFFKVVKDWNGIAQIERPRSSELFQKIQTVDGEKKVWCTFSHDQIDLDFSNPAVLLEFLKIIKFYIKKNIKIFRLDAVAFLWKKQNTSCINLQETHYIIKLIRFVSTLIDKNAILITETNIPSKENLSYFGNNDEAHWIYNFTLSPLILFTLLGGNCSQLRKWSMTMPPAQEGNAYFNFLASHDGIGLRPVEGKLDSTELYRLINKMRELGGRISYKTSQWGEEIPYEINITYLNSLKSTFNGEEKFQIKRFICAHAIMFAMEGIPAIYIHSFLGTKNDYKAIAAGEIGPIILGRDHHDVSGTDSPYRETSNIYDGSQFTADMAIQNVIGDSFRGATWVSIHNGGGVGWGEVINGGFGMVLDGSIESEKKLKSMLFWDVNNGVARRNWARNKGATFAIKRAMENEPKLKITLPNCVDETLFDAI